MFSESDGYERFMGRWSRLLAPPFVAFSGVTEGDRVLDVGSGTGAVATAAAAIESVVVTGIERVPMYVRSAQAQICGRFAIGDALALPFSDDAFDRTLSMLVLNFVPDPSAALREMVRVTRTGGVVAAAVWDYSDGMQMLQTFWDAAVALDRDAAPRDERHMPLCTPGSLSELWRTQHLQHVDEQPLTIEMAFASFDDYWQPFLHGQGPAGVYVSSLSESARRALESRLRSAADLAQRARAWAVRGVVT